MVALLPGRATGVQEPTVTVKLTLCWAPTLTVTFRGALMNWS